METKNYSVKEIVKEAVKALSKGETIVFPTETSYGLGADATNEKAVKKIIKIKKQPQPKEISVIISSLNQIEKYCIITNETRKLVKKFMPGPLTLIIPKKKNSLNWLGKDTLAFRISSNKIAFEICKAFVSPITATSANIHGKPSIYSGKEAIKEFSGKVSLIIDSGNLPKIKASTLFDVEQKKILREGAIKEKEILRAFEK